MLMIFLERQKATRQLKKLRKRLIDAESVDEVETLKAQMHVVEVDLNYTQYYPLCEVYISLYPQKSSGTDEPITNAEETKPKPPMWIEVEKCMANGTLNQLRNRVLHMPANISRPLEMRQPKSKPQPDFVDTVGLNRRERRSLRGISEKKPKNKSMGFEKNQTFGALHEAQRVEAGANQDNDSDGGFFE
jgi:hypothetical protein